MTGPDEQGDLDGVLPSWQSHDPGRTTTVDPEDVLGRLANLDVRLWLPANADAVVDADAVGETEAVGETAADARTAKGGGATHIGPAAEDFLDAFDLDTAQGAVAAGDADGVAIAAIQGLISRQERQRERIDKQASQLDEQASRIDEQQDELDHQRAIIAEQRDDLEALRETVESLVAGVVALQSTVSDRGVGDVDHPR